MSQSPITPEQMAALSPEFRALLQAVVDHYERRIAELEAKVEQLESRLNNSPRNSSLPPSAEHPHAKPAPPREKSGRKPGGTAGRQMKIMLRPAALFSLDLLRRAAWCSGRCQWALKGDQRKAFERRPVGLRRDGLLRWVRRQKPEKGSECKSRTR
jgi:transposase